MFVTNFCYHLLPRISPCFMPAMSEFRCQILGLRLRRLCNIAIDKKGRARARAGPGKQAVSAGCLREWMEQSAIKRAKNMNMPYLFDFLTRSSLEDGGQADRTQAGEGDRRTERPSRFGMSRMRHGQRRRNGKRWHACNDRREGGGKASFCALDLQLQPNGL